jgi:fructose-1,6-bisphosphatase II
MGGDMQGVLKIRNDGERDRALRMGITDLDHIFAIEELASGDVMFAATGVTDGFLLRGVRFTRRGADTHSIVMRSRSGTVRFIESRHRFEGHPVYSRPLPPHTAT